MEPKRSGVYSLSICLFVIISSTFIVSAENQAYWQTFAKSKTTTKIDSKEQHVCLPTSTDTVEKLGAYVTKNSTTVCISSNIVVQQVHKESWNVDFEVQKRVLSVIVGSGSTRAMTSMLKNFVIFGSEVSLKQTVDYKSFYEQGYVTECVRYLGGAFKRNEKRTFKCHQEVTGRYLYIWGLGSHRIMSDFIEMVKIQFAVEVINRIGTETENPKMYKQYAMSFVHMSRWDVTDKGIWLITMSEVYNINHLLVKVPKILHGTVIKAMKVDLAILDIKGMGSYSKLYKSALSPSGQEFIFEINFKANNIRMMADEGDYLLTDDAIESIELMYENQQGEMNIITEQVHVMKTEILKEVVRKLEIKAELQVWLEPTYENTGWIMVDMKQRFFIVTVAITSGNSAKVTEDLQGLVISTSNMIPEKVLNEMSKLEFDLCGEVGDNVTIQPASEKLIKCMPQASLGTYVLIYNKRKPLRISAIRRVVVYVQVHNIQKMELPVPVFPRVLDKPLQTTIVFTNFIVVTSTMNMVYGYWVIDMFEARPVHSVVVKAGVQSANVKAFVVYVQNSFIHDHAYICARMMTENFAPNTEKYLQCCPGPKTGRYVIVSKSTGGYPADSFQYIEVWFYVAGVRYYWNKFDLPETKVLPPTYPSPIIIDWFNIYHSNRYQSKPKAWWVIDLKDKHTIVYNVVVTFASVRTKLLESWVDLYAGVMNEVPSDRISVCSFRSNYPFLNAVDNYNFVCSNHREGYRYVIIRSILSCTKFTLDLVRDIKVVFKEHNTFKHVNVDTISFKAQVPRTRTQWQLAHSRLYESNKKTWYLLDLKDRVQVALVTFTVFKRVRTNSLRIYVSDQPDEDSSKFSTCFFHQSEKAENFYPNSLYKFRCNSRNLSKKYLLIQTHQNYIKEVKVFLKAGGSYYYATSSPQTIQSSRHG